MGNKKRIGSPSRTAPLAINAETCQALGGTWNPQTDTCSFNNKKITAQVNVYRGDPCMLNPDQISKYILVPYTKNVMTSLKNAMKKGG